MFAFNLHMLLNIWQSVLVLFRYINFVFDFVVTDKNENVMSLHDLLIPPIEKNAGSAPEGCLITSQSRHITRLMQNGQTNKEWLHVSSGRLDE